MRADLGLQQAQDGDMMRDRGRLAPKLNLCQQGIGQPADDSRHLSPPGTQGRWRWLPRRQYTRMVSLRGPHLGQEQNRVGITPRGDATSDTGGLFPTFMAS